MDMRQQLDPRLRPGGTQDFDLRDPRAQQQQQQQDRFAMDPRSRDRDERTRGDRDMRDPRGDRDLRDPRLIQASTAPANLPSDPRARRAAVSTASSSSATDTTTSAAAQAAAKSMTSFAGMAGFGPGTTDSEKAALIMQVLQLSDEQIAKLPPPQKESILVLKQQIAKSTQR